ncbi:MlrC C-terminal domain-containing protein [Mesorhizobium sp. M0142]|uniref:MlrC C-terminal domain-containing protein n=1 Tax=Mesorhizobium sp. M0142 TaxID=2956894 RepID=UPI0033375ACE
MSDNSGAGAPGDAVHVLRELLARGVTNVASGLYWDPMTVRQCEDAGEVRIFRCASVVRPNRPRVNRSTYRVASCESFQAWASTSERVWNFGNDGLAKDAG